MDQQKDFWRADLGRYQSSSEVRFDEIRALIKKNQSEMLSYFAEIGACLNRLENQRRILQ